MRSSKLFTGIFFILLGVSIALDMSEAVTFSGARLITAGYLGLFFLIALLKLVFERKNYLPLAMPIAGVSALLFATELTGRSFTELWPTAVLGVTLGALVYFVVEKHVKSSVISLYATALLMGVQIGLIAGGWLYILPALCVLTGALIILPVWGKQGAVPEIPMRSIVKRYEELKGEKESDQN